MNSYGGPFDGCSAGPHFHTYMVPGMLVYRCSSFIIYYDVSVVLVQIYIYIVLYQVCERTITFFTALIVGIKYT